MTEQTLDGNRILLQLTQGIGMPDINGAGAVAVFRFERNGNLGGCTQAQAAAEDHQPKRRLLHPLIFMVRMGGQLHHFWFVESLSGALSGPLLSFLPNTEIFTYRFGCTRRSSSRVLRLRVVLSRF